MSKNCVFCNSPDNLNTSFIITLDDGEKIEVLICDEHAEDATVKSAKKAYLEKKSQIDAILQQAKALGLELVEEKGLAIMKSAPKNPPAPQERRMAQPRREEVIEEEEGFVPTDLIDSRNAPMPKVVSSSNTNVESYYAADLNSVKGRLPENALKGQAKIGVFEGRQGQPIALVQQRKDGLGTTNVQIVKKENDRALQERFKRMADNSMRDDTPDFAKAGYQRSFTDCPLCRGSGEVRNGRKSITCPKCQGSGIIDLA